ncbi:MAG TPA: molybdopterin cofactor-binding domain-containing protein [Actinomycetota bacterium]|nr:molybdopterin cofactor-binding domain-containing protein [Actinomycetota bacterium]
MTQVAEPEVKRWVGGGLLRKEDPELLTGQGRYVDDIALPGMLWLSFVRSPVAHATITSIDTSAAKQLPGVQAVFTGQELAEEWAAAMPCAWPIADRTMPDEPSADARIPDHWPVAKDRVNFMGEIVAVVVADSREHAADAIEAVEVDYDELPVVTDMMEAIGDGAMVIHDSLGTNKAYTWVLTNGDVDKVFAEAPVVVKERYYNQRLIPNAIEPRGVVVQPVPAQGEYTVWSATQIPHILKVLLGLTLNISEAKVRVIAPDVGGGFGSKLNVYAEECVALAVARRLGMPIKWTEERSEGYLATIHGRDVIQDMEVAATEEGKTLGFRVKLYADFGAYMQLVTPGIPILGAWLYHGVYQGQAYSFEANGVFTNKTPTDAYRGAGRPEATYAVERVMDALARRVGKDPAEIREMNFMPPFDEAREALCGLSFDSGNYQATMDKAKRLAGYDKVREEQQANGGRRNGKLLGVGISTYIEMCGLAPSQILGAVKYGAGGWEAATIRCHPTGKVTVITGTSPHGQGHVTTWSQVTADALGVDPDDVDVLHGDTAVSALGMDSYGSRSASVGAEALVQAAEKIRAKARIIAAHELEVAEEDLEWKDGKFQVSGAPDRAKTIPEVAFSAWTAHALPAEVEPGLEATAVFDPPNFTFPSGAHICVVEVDPETGSTRIDKYVAVDDCGTVINPMIVDGQVMGGVAQGIAEALYEEALYDENGTLLTGNMSTYRIPSAAELPGFVLDREVTPSTTNQLGIKGIGEAGTIASPPAVMNAVADALRFVGVEFIDKPASAERVWRAVQAAEGKAPGERVAEGGGTGAASMTPEEEGGMA